MVVVMPPPVMMMVMVVVVVAEIAMMMVVMVVVVPILRNLNATCLLILSGPRCIDFMQQSQRVRNWIEQFRE